MEVGQIGLGIQLVLLVVVGENNCIQGRVQIHHQMKLGCLVLESCTMRKFAMEQIVSVSLNENERNVIYF
jgi:hypothetical protein